MSEDGSLIRSSNSPQHVQRLLSGLYTNDNKIKVLRDLKRDCLSEVDKYKKKYRKMKRIDDAIDATNAMLTGTSITMTVMGMSMPPLLIVSASLSGFAFISGRVQDKLNFKAKYLQHNQTFTQYAQIAREITTVLTKNNLSGDEHLRYIQEIFDKIALIEDSQLF